MQGPVVLGNPVMSKVLLLGQAPGFKEIEVHKPFAWTAGKTMFGWFASIGLDERSFRQHVYKPVGRLAIGRLMPVEKLKDVVGQKYPLDLHGVRADIFPLPHPSGASTWHRTEPGKTLLQQALSRIRKHPAWTALTCGRVS